jgi:hypothetical protein
VRAELAVAEEDKRPRVYNGEAQKELPRRDGSDATEDPETANRARVASAPGWPALPVLLPDRQM